MEIHRNPKKSKEIQRNPKESKGIQKNPKGIQKNPKRNSKKSKKIQKKSKGSKGIQKKIKGIQKKKTSALYFLQNVSNLSIIFSFSLYPLSGDPKHQLSYF